MTDPVFGRATPVHFMMLELACFVESASTSFTAWPPRTQEEALCAMVQARADLFYLTEQDFGYDLAAWRAFFIGRIEAGEEDFGYGHRYAASRVDAVVLAAIADPRRRQLEADARAAEAYIEPVERRWWP